MPQEFKTRSPIAFAIVEQHRDREGFAIIASVRDAYGNLLEYVCTAQHPTSEDAMEAFTKKLGRL